MESKNLIIRESVFDDCKYFAEWEVLPEVTEFFTIDEGRDYEQVVTEFVRYNLDPTKLQFTITMKPEDKPIGKIYISRINRAEDSMDITRIYIADTDLRGKGYGEEALRLILDHAFINLHMERVTIDHFEKNRNAAGLYEKIGFKNEGLMRNAGKKNGKYINLQLKSMLRAEYYDKLHK
ncbi:MAG: GNAT family N-acetyltransferase [Firmicutes bacterium]|nr:GNAT family N-acetyltransferase [Bacillota bacterium]